MSIRDPMAEETFVNAGSARIRSPNVLYRLAMTSSGAYQLMVAGLKSVGRPGRPGMRGA
jgi:hypothetical protein